MSACDTLQRCRSSSKPPMFFLAHSKLEISLVLSLFLVLGFSADEIESLKNKDADFKRSVVDTYACQKTEMYAKDFFFLLQDLLLPVMIKLLDLGLHLTLIIEGDNKY